MPAACPSNPDGSKRKVPSEDELKHVTLFQSNDAGRDFEQVRAHAWTRLVPSSEPGWGNSWPTGRCMGGQAWAGHRMTEREPASPGWQTCPALDISLRARCG